jgi:hypothetical protein
MGPGREHQPVHGHEVIPARGRVRHDDPSAVAGRLVSARPASTTVAARGLPGRQEPLPRQGGARRHDPAALRRQDVMPRIG